MGPQPGGRMSTYIEGAKSALPIELAQTPPRLGEIFERLARAGAPEAALFGGAARDADLGELWSSPRPIRDYDLRCWLDPQAMRGDWDERFGQALLKAFEGSTLSMEASAGTGRLRHVLRWEGVELDISARAKPFPQAGSRDCAIDRALDSDANLSAVAIASDMTAWCERLYERARQTRELIFYPNADSSRLAAYAERMVQKFPSSPVIFMRSQPAPKSPSP